MIFMVGVACGGGCARVAVGVWVVGRASHVGLGWGSRLERCRKAQPQSVGDCWVGIKVVRSLYLFEQKDLMESAQHYARLVQRDHKAGQSFTYGRIVLDELLYFSLPRRGKQPTAADAPGAAADTTADPDGPVAAIHECICDASEAYPIVGIRHHKIGTDIDLSQDEFDKLDGEAKADFELILKPGDAAIPYSLAAHHAAAAVGKAASVAASEAPAPAPPAPPMSPTSAYLYAAGMALATSAE